MKKFLLLICFACLNLIVLAQEKPVPKLNKNNIKQVIKALTLEEKVKLVVGMGMYISGAPAGLLPPNDPEDDKIAPKVPGTSGRTHAIKRLGIPSITLSDGPAGIHFLDLTNAKPKYATAIPIGTLLASTWDTIMTKKAGEILGREAKEYGIDIVLTPAFNIQRNPLGGRNFEYYSEDPFLSGTIAAAVTNGIQKQGIGVSVKHFAANNTETNRMKLNTIVSERTLREIYLKGFEIAVKKSNPWTLMTSYNLINGTYTSESKKLISTILRKEWGFKGLVMSDWFAGQNAAISLGAGNDLQMPGRPDQVQTITNGVKNGSLAMSDLNSSVERVLNLVVKTITFNKYNYSNEPDLTANAAISRMVASEGMVLLKNDKALPLPKSSTIALFGNASYDIIAGGTGSGDVVKKYTISLDEGLLHSGFKLQQNAKSTYEDYVKLENAKKPAPSFMDVFNPFSIKEMDIKNELITTAEANSDIAIITIGRISGESKDRKVENDFNLTDAEKQTLKTLSESFHAKNKKVIVVINAGGVVEMASWSPWVDAILMAWQPGMEGGNAIADILSGKVNPSGKLTATFPISYNDVPSAGNFPGKQLPLKEGEILDPVMPTYPAEITYDDEIYLGYRYFNTKKVKTAYEFGYGLSYTQFEYSTIKLNSTDFTDKITATITIKNTGKVAGKEVVQLYLSAPSIKLKKPFEELKGFAKTKLLQPNESQTISFTLTPSELASFDPTFSSWIAEAGKYTIRMGASSLDIKQTKEFGLKKDILVK
ncbi:glycoside hydrolase family 3 C-terminal domain-containing protein [Flavobacterium sp. 83]|uniref:glycoside hydrolase family 3 C-terminal domain-containing protein n=1 Tax=Flavobacterium sp. 83 TaxID=1131812 RepID=UPI00068D5123|nr:glycoside hydrolase family 3 C-terminal domain-containing protein [Flavobacterium sp. 83]